MEKRTLTITLQPDWKKALRIAGKAAQQSTYQGERLNFESPGMLFSRLTEERWNIIESLRKADAMNIYELARHVQRDVKNIQEDVQVLVDLGLLERTDKGTLLCPYADIHVDMHIVSDRQAA